MDGNTKVSSKICNHRGLDTIIVDLLDDLPIPYLPKPLQFVPKWNKHNVCTVEAIFEIDDAYLHNDVVVLLFVLQSTKVRKLIYRLT